MSRQTTIESAFLPIRNSIHLLFLTILHLILPILSFSQSSQETEQWPQWVYYPENERTSVFTDISVDGEGNVYQIGYLQDSNIIVDFGPEIHEDIYLEKLSRDGKSIWKKTLYKDRIHPDSPYDLYIEAFEDGTFVIAGISNSEVDLDPGPGEYRISPDDYRVNFVAGYSKDGQLLWVRELQLTIDASLNDLECDKEDRIILCGTMYDTSYIETDTGIYELSPPTNWFGYIYMLSKTGVNLGIHTFSTTRASDVRSAAFDSKGNIYVAGQFNGTMVLNAESGMDSLIHEYPIYVPFIVQIDSVGSVLWNGFVSGYNRIYVTDLAIDRNDNVYMSGYYKGLADLDPTTRIDNHNSPGQNVYESYLVKINSNNEFVWARDYDQTDNRSFKQMAFGISGSLYILGRTHSLVSFKQKHTKDELEFSYDPAVSGDPFLLKMDSLGDPLMLKPFITERNTKMERFEVDESENIFTTGKVTQYVAIDNIRFNSPRPTEFGESVTVKLNSCPPPQDVTMVFCNYEAFTRHISGQKDVTSVIRIPKNSGCDSFVRIHNDIQPSDRFHKPVISPNPNSGVFKIENISAGAQVGIYSSTGQLVLTIKEAYPPLFLSHDFANGIYFVVSKSECGVFTTRFVVR